MSSRSRTVAVVLALGLGTVWTVPKALAGGEQIGQTERPPVARMPARDLSEAATGAARISGRVLAADTGMPLRRAVVRLTSGDVPGGRLTTTDPEGRYSFAELPGGRYSLHASKAGFVSLQHGQTRPFEPGRPIDLAEKQDLQRLDFLLPRGGVITGRILDEFGEPVAEAVVQVLRYQYVDGERQLAPVGRSDQTDDLGRFRIYGLSPGDYVVSAAVRGGMAMMPAPGPIAAAGGMLVVGGMTGAPDETAERTGYAPTYFPGTPDAGEAQRVRVLVGQETSGIAFVLVETRLSRISGVALRADGSPMSAGVVTLLPGDRSRRMAMMAGGRSGRIQRDGSFTIVAVPPGEYVLQARAAPERNAGGGEQVVVFGPGGPEMEMAMLPVTVAGGDLSGLTLMATRGATVPGRVVFEGTTPSPADLQRVRVSAMPGTPAAGMAFVRPGSASGVREDGAFELRNLIGPRLIRVTTSPGWILKAVYYAGRDIADVPFDFARDDDGGLLEVVLTDRAAEVSGTVADGRGGLAEASTVIVFADDPDRWGLQSRFIRTARPDQDGRYQVTALPATTYVAVALDYVESGQWTDPDFLDRIRPLGTRFTLGEGESRALDLRLSTTGPP
jgi:hypothetical protein